MQRKYFCIPVNEGGNVSGQPQLTAYTNYADAELAAMKMLNKAATTHHNVHIVETVVVAERQESPVNFVVPTGQHYGVATALVNGHAKDETIQHHTV